MLSYSKTATMVLLMALGINHAALAAEQVEPLPGPDCRVQVNYLADDTPAPQALWQENWSCGDWQQILSMRQQLAPPLLAELAEKQLLQPLQALLQATQYPRDPGQVIALLNQVQAHYPTFRDVKVLLDRLTLSRALGDSLLLHQLEQALAQVPIDNSQRDSGGVDLWLNQAVLGPWRFLPQSPLCEPGVPLYLFSLQLPTTPQLPPVPATDQQFAFCLSPRTTTLLRLQPIP